MKKKILVVDDEASLVKLLKSRLEANSYEVWSAGTGKECLKLLEKQTPDLIVLDIIMPEMDGIDTISELKNNPKTQKVPVIFLTALKTANDQSRLGVESAGNVILAKPFESEELLKKIKECIG